MFAELLSARLSGIVKLSLEQIALLESHYELLKRWNRSLNLTRIEELEQAVERHYCESLFLAALLPQSSLALADVGSGAGFPGFPVAVLRPDCSVTLIEAHQRKSVFLREASRSVPNIRVLTRRAEEIHAGFDRVISRAVSYSDLARCLKNLAPEADLLTGDDEPPPELGFTWSNPIPLPWGSKRYLRSGSRHA